MQGNTAEVGSDTLRLQILDYVINFEFWMWTKHQIWFNFTTIAPQTWLNFTIIFQQTY